MHPAPAAGHPRCDGSCCGEAAGAISAPADAARRGRRDHRVDLIERRLAMKGLVFHGPGRRAWESVPDPSIAAPGDVIVRIDSSTICGTDLHILKGDVPEVTPGTILGHEAVGTIVETGPAVTTLAEGDRVLVSCITSCGRCRFCREGHYGLCTGGGGWIFGHLIDGLQAEYARVPFAETSVHRVPQELSDEQVLFLADILPTSYEVGVLAGRVGPGDTVAVVGAGPIGLAAIMTARLFTPGRIVAIDLAPARLAKALDFGADVVIDNGVEDPVARMLELTDGLGADVAIEAVGVPETFELCTELIRPGGRVANVGVHGHPATLHLEKLWIRDVTITTGLVDTSTTPQLLKLIADGRLDPTPFATHRFDLGETEEAYDTFADAASTNALKVVLSAHPVHLGRALAGATAPGEEA
jgi:alcohol dehydrogenase